MKLTLLALNSNINIILTALLTVVVITGYFIHANAMPAKTYTDYPTGGHITIERPSNGRAFGIRDQVSFKWSAPDVRVPDQPFSYYIKIVKLAEGQDPTAAVAENEAWFERTTEPLRKDYGFGFGLKKELDRRSDYAWQVTAFSDGQEVGNSDVYTFKGPNIVEDFYAGQHLIEVVSTENTDLTDLSGICRLKISEEDTVTIPFRNLSMEPVGSTFHRLNSGQITYQYEEPKVITLASYDRVAENGDALFSIHQLKLNEEGLSAQGIAQWAIPLATLATEPVQLRSDTLWATYDNYRPSGSGSLSHETSLELADPSGFGLSINRSSQILVLQDHYEVVLEGHVVLPSSVSGRGNERVKLPFDRATQLFYFKQETSGADTAIIVPNTALGMAPRSFTVDLSSMQSPGELATDANWKGIYVEAFDLVFSEQAASVAGLTLPDAQRVTYDLRDGADFTNRIDADGLDLSLTTDLAVDHFLHVYPATLSVFTIDIMNSEVLSGTLRGDVLIPSHQATDRLAYSFTLDGGGLSASYLDNAKNQRTLLQAPFMTTATDTTHESFVARWFTVPEASGYELEVSTDNFATLASEVTYELQADTTALLTGLKANTTYQYRVKAMTSENVYTSLVAQQRTLPMPDTVEEIVLGTEDNQLTGTLDVYPNPAQDIITVRGATPIRIVSIANLHGRSLAHYQQPGELIELPALTAGVYLLRIQFYDGQVAVRKLMIE